MPASHRARKIHISRSASRAAVSKRSRCQAGYPLEIRFRNSASSETQWWESARPPRKGSYDRVIAVIGLPVIKRVTFQKKKGPRKSVGETWRA